jgi:hypothetical protein
MSPEAVFKDASETDGFAKTSISGSEIYRYALEIGDTVIDHSIDCDFDKKE